MHKPKQCPRKKDATGLTEKQRRFVEAYMGEAEGNGTQAARLAGYTGSLCTLQSIASENLSKAAVRQAIDARVAEDPKIATRKRRQEFWTAVMYSDAVEMKDRLKASELLGRTHGDFMERREISGPNGGPVTLARADVDLSKLSDDQLKMMQSLLEQAQVNPV